MASAYATLAARGLLGADGDPPRRACHRQRRHRRGLGEAEAHAGDPRRCRLHRHTDSREEHPVRDRHRGQAGQAGRRQDGDDRRARRRLVHRVHAGARDNGVGGLSAGRDPDAERARHLCCRRNLSSDDLAPVHGGRARPRSVLRLPRAEGMARVEAVHAWPVRSRLGPAAATGNVGRATAADVSLPRAGAAITGDLGACDHGEPPPPPTAPPPTVP